MSLLYPIAGGVLIGLAAVWLFLSLGRIAGISGIAASALQGLTGSSVDQRDNSGHDRFRPLFFIVGLGAGGALAYLLTDITVESDLTMAGLPMLIVVVCWLGLARVWVLAVPVVTGCAVSPDFRCALWSLPCVF